MAKPTQVPPPWGGAGNYPATVYPAELPWGAVHPDAGNPQPWSNKPRLDAAGLIAFANNGLSPSIPTEPELFNEWFRQLQLYIEWVDLGTSADDADAHIMETDAAGISYALKYQATVGFCGDAGGSAIMLGGATIPNGESLTMTGSADIDGVNATIAKVGAIELLSGAAAPLARQLNAGATGDLTWNPGSSLRKVHNSPNGWVYATGDQETATPLVITTLACTTTQTVTGFATGNVRVIVEGWVQVNVLGSTIDIDVQEDQTANPAFTDIGAAQQILALKTSATTTDWQYFRHERVYNSGIVDDVLYKVKVGANGGATARIRETHLRVVNDEA